nr:immunoglobulin heavy chain junction region [Mus musculus]NSM06914.1 immunoglobulin heavy chain junction region [Mus musculus]NSM07097.1 immunoglobulin heavy chain junction region [Mus musculus]NSM07815.1 immunoglobulin heavy chain junction region [Mus musculus]NSM09417.1 immunoglobulin heavy chain junction region [Mus musculus]
CAHSSMGWYFDVW